MMMMIFETIVYLDHTKNYVHTEDVTNVLAMEYGSREVESYGNVIDGMINTYLTYKFNNNITLGAIVIGYNMHTESIMLWVYR